MRSLPCDYLEMRVPGRARANARGRKAFVCTNRSVGLEQSSQSDRKWITIDMGFILNKTGATEVLEYRHDIT
jgi:hypothetical protein